MWQPSVTLEAKALLYNAMVISVLIYGCETWAETTTELRVLETWHNARRRELCRITMWQVQKHHISDYELATRTKILDLRLLVAARRLQWLGRVARMPKQRLPRRLLTAWVRTPRPPGGQAMTYGRRILDDLELLQLPLEFPEWAHLAQDVTAWRQAIGTQRCWLLAGEAEDKRQQRSLARAAAAEARDPTLEDLTLAESES